MFYLRFVERFGGPSPTGGSIRKVATRICSGVPFNDDVVVLEEKCWIVIGRMWRLNDDGGDAKIDVWIREHGTKQNQKDG